MAVDTMIKEKNQKHSKVFLKTFNNMNYAIELFDKFEVLFNNIRDQIFISLKSNSQTVSENDRLNDPFAVERFPGKIHER